jgi:hypothetical protein
MQKAACFVLLIFTLGASAQPITNYRSLDKNNPVEFYGNSIIYQGQKIELNEKTFFVDGQLPEAVSARYPFVFSSFNEAVEHLSDGTETQPMTIYIAPYVYWIDDPDDTEVRVPQAGARVPVGLHVKCNHLKIIGLTDHPQHVSLACNRGQSLGSKGNFTMFSFEGDDLYFENLTMANYCNIPLNFPLKPALNRPKRSETIVQAQLAFCNGDRIEAHNVHFLSRLNTCNLVGGKRTLFDRCHIECTDDALATGVYLNCTFDFYSSKPFGHASGTGAVMLNCDFNVIASPRQYFTKRQGPVTVVDSRFHSKNESLYVGWNQDPTDDFRGYQYNVQLNGKPILIHSDQPRLTVDMDGKPILSAYRFEHQNQTVYNIYNLLRGNDNWDPMKMQPVIEEAEQLTGKNLHEIPTFLWFSENKLSIETGSGAASQLQLTSGTYGTYGGKNIEPHHCSWEIIGDRSLIHFSQQDCSAKISGNNPTDTTKSVILNVTSPSGLQAAVVVEVMPPILDAPPFTSLPQIVEENENTLRVDYKLDLGTRSDESIITWYKSKSNTIEGAIPVVISRNNPPETVYSLSQSDVGY